MTTVGLQERAALQAHTVSQADAARAARPSPGSQREVHPGTYAHVIATGREPAREPVPNQPDSTHGREHISNAPKGDAMAFTQISVTGSFDRPDGQPAQGTVTAALSARMVNGTEVIEPTPVTGYLDAAGQLVNDSGEQPFTVAANDDAATTPAGTVYRFVLELDSGPIDPFEASVPSAAPGATIDITELMP